MAAVLCSSCDSLLVNDAASDGKFVPFVCGNMLSLSSGCWNYIKLDAEVIRGGGSGFDRVGRLQKYGRLSELWKGRRILFCANRKYEML